jgi:hypothetical protein
LVGRRAEKAIDKDKEAKQEAELEHLIWKGDAKGWYPNKDIKILGVSS